MNQQPPQQQQDKLLEKLGEAILRGDVAATKRLLPRKVSANPSLYGMALVIAAGYGREKIVRTLLKDGVSVNHRLPDGTTALIMAAAPPVPGQDKIVEVLLKAGAHIDVQNKDGRTALMQAAENNNVQTTRVLLAHKANQRLTDKEGQTAAQLAQSDAIKAMLRRAQTGTTGAGYRRELVRAVERGGSVAELKRLLARAGADVNARDDEGKTLLHMAAEKGNLPVAQVLLEHKAQVNARTLDYWKWTPLILAAGQGHTAMVKLLLAKGADPNLHSRQGYTALHRAMTVSATTIAGTPGIPSLGSKDVVVALLNSGADINATGEGGATPLMDAANYGNVQIVEILLNRGAKIDVRSSEGENYTALLVAAERGHTQVVRSLLKYKPDLTLRNRRGETALDLARKEGRTEIVQMLQSAAVQDR